MAGGLRSRLLELKLQAGGLARLGADVDAFPPIERVRENGVLAVGGDWSPGRLLAAYRRGIFPMAAPGGPILWRCPDPRYAIDLAALRVPKDVQKAIRREKLEIRLDTSFAEVIRRAATVPRKNDWVRWITDEVIDSYEKLHRMGYAHSAEAWRDGRLVGGTFGMALGRTWFGESTFHLVTDAGSVVMGVFLDWLRQKGFSFMDCQVFSAHFARMGQTPWPRARFLAALAESQRSPDFLYPWSLESQPPWEAAAREANRQIVSEKGKMTAERTPPP